jgi:hypothetical protein
MAIGVLGQPLPFPTNLWQPGLPGIASSVWSNELYLLAGQRFTLPPGWWAISGGTQTTVQLLDPVSEQWVPVVSAARLWFVNSDGTNYRIANLNQTLIGGTVTAAGTGYAQATTTITATTGISTWVAIVGGAVNSTVTIGTDKNGVTGGTNFTMAPVLVVQAPPAGGRAATMSCTVSAGAINAVTVRDAGAGYQSAPGILVVPDPLDPTLGAITIPTLTATLTGAGTVTGIMLVNPGLPVASAPSLTVSGAGSGATATATLFNSASTADTVFLQWLGGGG